MNWYLIEKETEMNRGEIVHAVRRSLQDLYPGSVPASGPVSEPTREDTFLLRFGNRQLWGKVFFEPLSYAGLESLTAEIESFAKPLRIFIFFPSLVKGISGCLADIPGRPHFFEYCFLRSPKQDPRGEGGLALQQWPSDDDGKTASPPSAMTASPPRLDTSIWLKNDDSPQPRETFRFYRHARLTREELAELMEIGLDLRKLPAV